MIESIEYSVDKNLVYFKFITKNILFPIFPKDENVWYDHIWRRTRL